MIADLVPLSSVPLLPPSNVKVSKKWVTIRRREWRRGWNDYSFELSRCDTPEKLLNWVLQLCRKTWFTTRDAIDLIHKVADHFGWKVEGRI